MNKAFSGKKTQEKANPTGHVKDGADVFEDDWQRDRDFWVRRYHARWNYAYTAFRSIMTTNEVYGKQFLETVGLQSYVPLTYQTIVSLWAQVNSKKITIKNKAQKLKSKKRQEFLDRLDNAEFTRSKSNSARVQAMFYVLLLGMGWIASLFVDDVRTAHYVVPPTGKAEGDPESAEDDLSNDLNWEEKEITRYRGMKLFSWNPWYVFPDCRATSRDNMGHLYRYIPISVDEAIQYVVAQGWMTEEEAVTKITTQKIERFDAVRDTVDSFFSLVNWSKGDHANTASSSSPKSGDLDKDTNMTAFIERYEDNYYEIRVVGSNVPLYKDFNIYPDKGIPAWPVFNEKVPDEMDGIGEPEKIRYQQMDANRLNSITYQAVLMSVVQRYAIAGQYLEDETDASWQDQFRPIRLKKGIQGLKASDAIHALPQPEVGQAPFTMRGIILDTIQKVTGATDFVTATSDAKTDTATESDRLAAASGSRVREKLRDMDEEVIPAAIKQWHCSYPLFYSDGLEFRTIGDEDFGIFIADNRDAANSDKDKISNVATEYGVEAAKTLEETYRSAGFKQVVFLDEITNDFEVTTTTNDSDLDRIQNLNAMTKAMDTMITANKAAGEQGDTRRFDVFALGKELIRNLPQVGDPESYVIDATEQPKKESNMPFPDQSQSIEGQEEKQPETAGQSPQPQQEAQPIQQNQDPAIPFPEMDQSQAV